MLIVRAGRSKLKHLKGIGLLLINGGIVAGVFFEFGWLWGLASVVIVAQIVTALTLLGRVIPAVDTFGSLSLRLADTVISQNKIILNGAVNVGGASVKSGTETSIDPKELN